MNKALVVFALLAVSLTGCSGGGGGNSTPAPSAPAATTTAEGFWAGTSSTGYKVNLVILENGDTWGVYSSGGSIYGALHGMTNSSGTTLSGSGSDFYIPSQSVTPSTYTGTFADKSNISVTTSKGTSFTGTYDSSYDQPASLTSASGSFTGSTATGYSSSQTVTIGVSSFGVVSGTNGGCTTSGNATPRASGKNVFNVSLNFTGNCVIHGTSATGVAYYDAPNRTLLVMGLTSDQSDGFIFIGKN